MPTVYEELSAITKIVPLGSETYVSLARRLTKKINDLGDAEWESLSKAAQDWQNATVSKLNEGGSDLPVLDGCPEMKAPEPEPAPKAKAKPVAKKAAKPAKAPKAKAKASPAPKKAKAKVSDSEGRGRPGKFALTAKITVLAKANPKRKGSKAEKQFNLYKSGQTVEQALKAGVPWRDIRWDSEQKFIKVA